MKLSTAQIKVLRYLADGDRITHPPLGTLWYVLGPWGTDTIIDATVHILRARGLVRIMPAPYDEELLRITDAGLDALQA